MVGKENNFAEGENISDNISGDLETVILKLRPDLYRAYHRCSWIIIHETGRDQLSIMQEMVEDFLIKHGC